MGRKVQQDLPDLNCAKVARAALRIQSVYKGFQSRKKTEELKELKALAKDPQVAVAAVKIQAVYKGFQTRKKMKEDLPDLKCPEVAKAAVNIQRVYRGFQGRQKVKKVLKKGKNDDDLP